MIINLASGHKYDVWASESLQWVLLAPMYRDDDKPLPAVVRELRIFPTPDDSFWITGRGQVFAYNHNPAQDLWDPSQLRGHWIAIDGSLFQVTGVEMWRPMISPSSPYGDRSLGLLVRMQTNLPEGYYESERLNV